MTLRRTTTAVLAAGCLTLGACSSSDGGGAADTTAAGSSSASTSSAPSSSTASSSTASSGGALESIVVQQGDVPSTFKPMAADTNDDSNAQVLSCIGAKSTKSDEKATVHSKDFSTETASISSEATRFGTQQSVDSDATIFRSPKIKSCFTALLRKEIGGGQSGAKVVSSKVDVTPGTNGGPDNVVATTTAAIVLEAKGKQVPVYVNSVYITGPKLEVEIDFTGFGTQFDSKLATTVASAVAKRAAKG